MVFLVPQSVKQAYNSLFFEQDLVREEATPGAALEPLVHWNEEKRLSNPVRGEMFIERQAQPPPNGVGVFRGSPSL